MISRKVKKLSPLLQMNEVVLPVVDRQCRQNTTIVYDNDRLTAFDPGQPG